MKLNSPAGDSSRTGSRGGALRIIVADDEFDTVATLKAILSGEGYEVLGVHSGRNALEAVRHFDPDAVLIDIALPDISGWEVARQIREMRGPGRPLLIAMSGLYTKTVDKLLGDVAGFDHYVTKPYDANLLITLVRGATAEGV